MENLILNASAKTPSINFNCETGVLVLRGRSIPENSIEFFNPIFDWVVDYKKSPQPTTQVDMRLEYFNTSSSKCILDFLKLFEAIHGSKSDVFVNWFFEMEDEDMEEAGEDYREIVKLKFNIIEVEEI